jgi:hypothetical protein
VVWSRAVEAETRRGRAWALARVVGLVVLVALVVRRVEWAAVEENYRGIDAGTAGAIAAAVLAAMGLRLHKWLIQVRAMGFKMRVGAATVARGFLLGVLLGAVTPLRLGEFYRVAAATAGEPGGRGRAAAGVLLDKGYELSVVLATLVVGAVLVGMSVGACLLVGAVTAAIGWLVLGRWRGGAGTGRVARGLATLAAAKSCLSAGDRGRLLLWTAAAHALNMAAGYALYRAFGELSVGDYVVRIPLITLINTVPVTVGGFGLRELTAIELFSQVGYPAAGAAVAAAGLFFAANVLPALVLLPIAAALASKETRS